jgi:predicted amidohydrolase YtcJ
MKHHPDMILYNGKIYTVDKSFTVVEAVVIRDGKFIAVGGNSEANRYVGPETKIIDLEGKPVTPGLLDAHCHPLGVGKNALAAVQIGAVHTKEALLKDLKEKTSCVLLPGEWITTNRNWPAFHFQPDELPTLADLDEAVPDKPLALPYGHALITNSLAMKVASITRNTSDPVGGTIVKDPVTGEPTGRFEEAATKLLAQFLPSPPLQECAKAGQNLYNSIGVTGVQDDGYDPLPWLELKASGNLTLRYGWSETVDPELSLEAIFTLIHAISGAGLSGLGGLGDDMARITGISFNNEALWPYPGRARWERDKLLQVCFEAAKCKLRVRQHCEAGMIPESLAIYVDVNKTYPIKGLRWAIGHQRWPSRKYIQIQKELGCVVNQDIAFAVLSVPKFELERKSSLPAEENRLFCPVPLWLKEGVPVCLTTDGGGACTPDALSIWACVWVATNRHLFPEFGPQFSISREEALKAITNSAAYWMGMEDRFGSIEVGKLADLAVLSADPITCPDEAIRDIKALMTIMNGQIVYKR